MGYRNYIAFLSKEEHEKIKHFSKEELLKYKNVDLEDDYVGIYDIVEKDLYEFGKYCEFGDEKFYSPLFENEKLQSDYEGEYDCYIVGKPFLKHIIEFYTKKVQDTYKNLLEDTSYEDLDSISSKKMKDLYSHVRDFSIDWLQMTPYDLDSGNEITTSWKYEYSIFELVRIYKTFDWEKNVMVYYGY